MVLKQPENAALRDIQLDHTLHRLVVDVQRARDFDFALPVHHELVNNINLLVRQ